MVAYTKKNTYLFTADSDLLKNSDLNAIFAFVKKKYTLKTAFIKIYWTISAFQVHHKWKPEESARNISYTIEAVSLLVLLVLLFRLFIKKIVSVPLIYSQKTRPTLFYYFFTLFEAVILVIPFETVVIEKRIQTTSSFWLLYLHVYVVTYSECNFCHSSSTLSQQSSTSTSMLEDIVNLFIYLFSIKYSFILSFFMFLK